MPSSETERATQTVISARRTWKNLREKNEAVWPPSLEIALIEALEKYRPGSRDTRNLRRFPKRNIWISQYILKTTGKHRTAKQVGSRLQQLRDTCDDPRVLNLLSRKEYPQEPEQQSDSPQWSSSTSDFAASSPAASSSAQDALQVVEEIISAPVVPSQTFVTVNVLPSVSTATNSSTLEVLAFSFEPQWQTAQCGQQQPTISGDLPLWSQKPIMTFTSSVPIETYNYISLFRVFIDGVHVHSEPTDIYLLSDNGAWVYGTRVIPGYWVGLSQNSDLSHCQIAQEIIHLGQPSAVVLSVMYEFNFRAQAPPLVHQSTTTLYPQWSQPSWDWQTNPVW